MKWPKRGNPADVTKADALEWLPARDAVDKCLAIKPRKKHGSATRWTLPCEMSYSSKGQQLPQQNILRITVFPVLFIGTLLMLEVRIYEKRKMRFDWQSDAAKFLVFSPAVSQSD